MDQIKKYLSYKNKKWQKSGANKKMITLRIEIP